MHKVTVIIPCFNEEANIAQAIEQVRWADEILVVDSFSTDRTVEITRAFPVKLLQRKFDTHARQKNWAIEQAANDWIFLLDADERVPKVLKTEIQQILATPDKTAYWIRRNNYFMGQRVKYSGWQYDQVIRLFNRQQARYEDKQVHEEIISQGPVGKLQQRLEHYTYRGLAQYLEKWDSYTWLAAKERLPRQENVTLYHLWLKPVVRFWRHYFMWGGFLDGKVGFALSYLSAGSVFMRYLKLWRLQEESSGKTPAASEKENPASPASAN